LSISRRAWPERPADYWLLDAQGGVVERFEVTANSLDDELAAALFVVEDGKLVKLVVSEIWGRQATCQEIVMLADLTAVPAGDTAGLQQVQAALAHAEAQRAQRMEQARARVAAIKGADNRYGASDAFDTAQWLLRERVASFDDPLSAALLQALVRFGALNDSAPCVEPALNAFVEACRHAAFDRTLRDATAADEALEGYAWPGAHDRAVATELVAMLPDLERELSAASDAQADVDAMNNAAAFAAAARCVARSRVLLDALLAG
ncbi:MAG TPA: hypothetical protein VJR58_06025, partial [Vineibacter sp.]|nr:hypothetical protein [Vineibacter sp.]